MFWNTSLPFAYSRAGLCTHHTWYFALYFAAIPRTVTERPVAVPGANWHVWDMFAIFWKQFFLPSKLIYVKTSARPDISDASLILRRPRAVSRICSKCGTLKKSGKPSCCASGGAWFQKCGDAADKNFNHTWVEGIQACKGKLLIERYW